jgi:hypothetical protein
MRRQVERRHRAERHSRVVPDTTTVMLPLFGRPLVILQHQYWSACG